MLLIYPSLAALVLISVGSSLQTRALRKATSFFAPASSSTASTPIPDIEECTLCTPFTVSKVEHQVTQYPMAKEKKKVREEETSVCVVEWRSSSTESKQKGSKFLLMKRPESGESETFCLRNYTLVLTRLYFHMIERTPGRITRISFR